MRPDGLSLREKRREKEEAKGREGDVNWEMENTGTQKVKEDRTAQGTGSEEQQGRQKEGDIKCVIEN